MGVVFKVGAQSTEVMTSKKKKKNFFAFERLEYHISVENDEKHPQPKFGGIRFLGAHDMAARIRN